MDLTICMLVFPDAQALDVVGPLEIFSAAPGVRVEIASAATQSCAMSCGVCVSPTLTLESNRRFDVLFVPGGSGLTTALGDARYREFVARQAASAKYVTSVCTGSLLLGVAGALRGYRAASHWRYADLLRLCGAEPVDERVVIDRNRITTGGVTAGIDFSLQLLAILKDANVAQYVQLAFEYHPNPPFGGHPSTAAPEITAAYRRNTSASYARREAEIRAALASPPRITS